MTAIFAAIQRQQHGTKAPSGAMSGWRRAGRWTELSYFGRVNAERSKARRKTRKSDDIIFVNPTAIYHTVFIPRGASSFASQNKRLKPSTRSDGRKSPRDRDQPFAKLNTAIHDRTMKFLVAVLAAALMVDLGVAWTSHTLSRTRSATILRSATEDEAFDWAALLSEDSASRTSSTSSAFSRRRIALPSQQNERSTILASAFPAPTEAVSEDQAAAADDPYASALDSQMQKINTYTEQKSPSFEDRLKNMDLQDIISTLILPSIALFAAGRWVYNRAASRVSENTDATLDAFASELIYHDGDFDEMKLCYGDYSRKLASLGPKKREAMLHRYLEAYAKKKTITPKAIASLSYVFTIAKLSEPAAAQLIVSLCRKMGPEKISSAGKLLFLGSRILKSPEGIEALQPVKEMIKGTYRDATVADTLVETSQQ